MDVHVLGAVSVIGDTGAPVALGGAKQRTVFAILALRANSVVSVDCLAEGVWGEQVPDRYVQNIQVYVSTLRRALEPGRTANMPSRILARGVGYELVLADGELDLARFRTSAGIGQRALAAGQPATAGDALRAALAEWRGDPCSDLAFQPFVERMTRSLHEERWEVFHQRMTAELENGKSGELVADLEDAVTREPTRERTWEQLITALYRAGRQADALSACRRARDVLMEELGLDPGPSLTALEIDILQQSPSLAAPPRASVRAARLPVPLTSLVGRDELVQSIGERLTSSRLVVLAGPGGVGKTRVALAVAAAAVAHDRTVYFADLSAERDPTRVGAALATAVGLGDGASVDDSARAAEASAALVVIDNFEQVIDAAETVATLASLAPSARFLVTSRIRLGLPGEEIISIEPLPTDDDGGPAVRLFWDRAIQVDPRLRPDDHAAAAVTICQAVDGMPLAIELAASRVTVFDPTELGRRIEAAVESIVDAGTDPRRHGSLRAAIRWSTDLLSSDELALFGCMSICRDSVDLPTMTALAGAAGLTQRQAERALEGLVRASLVRTTETPSGRRFGLLHTTKAVAREELAPDREAAARATHAMWFADRAWARVITERPDDTWLASAVADLADSTVALRWLSSHGEPDRATRLLGALFMTALAAADRYRFVRSLASDLAADPALPMAHAARARIVAGGMAYVCGDDDEAAALLDAVDQLDDDDHFFRARGAMWRAALTAEAGDHAGASEAAGLARRHARASGLPRLIGASWSVSGYVALSSGDPVGALDCAREHLGVESAGSWGEANAQIEVAYALLALDHLDEAVEQSRAALFTARRLGVPQTRGEAYRCMAWCALLQSDVATGAACLLQQLAVFDGLDAMTDRVAETILTTAIAAALGGRLSDGRRLWATGQHVLAARGLSTHDFPRNLLVLAEHLALDGGAPFTDDLIVALAEAASTLEELVEDELDIVEGATTDQ